MQTNQLIAPQIELDLLIKFQTMFNELSNRISVLESENRNLTNASNDEWMSLDEAAKKLGKSSTALYQRIKNKKKPMPKGTVWRQQVKGGSMFVHLKELTNYL